MEPIYETREGLIFKHGRTIPAFSSYTMRRDAAEHICRLLNADPLPEDRPPRFLVDDGFDFWSVLDLTLSGPYSVVARFCKHSHPGAQAAARTEADRLNGANHVPA